MVRVLSGCAIEGDECVYANCPRALLLMKNVIDQEEVLLGNCPRLLYGRNIMTSLLSRGNSWELTLGRLFATVSALGHDVWRTRPRSDE
jgi:hypothetical protein